MWLRSINYFLKITFLESKILSVSDVIEAMSSHRPYRAAFDMATTKAKIIDKRGSYYCPECVEACLRLIEENKNDARRLINRFLQMKLPDSLIIFTLYLNKKSISRHFTF